MQDVIISSVNAFEENYYNKKTKKKIQFCVSKKKQCNIVLYTSK